MKLQTRAFIRLAFVNLLLGLSAFLLAAAAEPLGLDARLAALRYPAMHFLTVGWLTQLIVGVAIWLFPLPPQSGAVWATPSGWVGMGLLNGGLVLRLLGEVGPAFGVSAWAGLALMLSALAQAIAAWLFVALLWPRLRPPRPRPPAAS